MIAELLSIGVENAITGRELAELIGCDIRVIASKIEKERRKGYPICAITGDNLGYYLAANDEELQNYCNRLNHRAAELHKTRRALLRIMDDTANKEKA